MSLGTKIVQVVVAFVFLLMPIDLDELFGLCLSNCFFVLICCQHTHQRGENLENQVDMNLDFIVMSMFDKCRFASDERFGLMLFGIVAPVVLP